MCFWIFDRKQVKIDKKWNKHSKLFENKQNSKNMLHILPSKKYVLYTSEIKSR